MHRFYWGCLVWGMVSGAAMTNAVETRNLRQTLQALLPAMGAEDIAESRDAQQQWQTICLALCKPGLDRQRLEAGRLMAEQLGPETPSAARIWMLRQLEYLGGAESVAALAAALDDPDPLVRGAARRALTSNPSPQATDQLVAKLAEAKDPDFKTGLLNALAYRLDPTAVDDVARALHDPHPYVVAAAARALGEIATPQAAEELKQARLQSHGLLRRALGNASLRCAATMRAKGQEEAAREIYTDLQSDQEPEPVQLATLYGLLTLDENPPVNTVLDILAGEDQAAAGVAAAQIGGLKATGAKQVAEQIGRLPAANQVLVLRALQVRSDKRVLPEVLKATHSEDPEVRIAALRALGSVGDASSVGLLLVALSEGGAVATAARRSLEGVYGENTDEKIIAAMQAAANSNRRALLIEILQRRLAGDAVPQLLEEALHRDPHVRRTAMIALGKLGRREDIPQMLGGVLAAQKGNERDEAEKAVMFLCNRSAEKDQRAAPILEIFDTLDAEDQKNLLPLLGRIGGPQSLEIIQVALQSPNPDLSSVGLRALCNWPDGNVAQNLLDLFKTSVEERDRLRAMRAFIRVIALRHERPNAESLEMLRQAMEFCSRDKERNLILSRTASAEIRSIEALRFVLPYLKNPATAQQACRAIVGLSHHRYLRRPNQAEFNAALNEVIALSEDIALVDQARRYRSDL